MGDQAMSLARNDSTTLCSGLPLRRSYNVIPRSVLALASTSVSLGLKRTTLAASMPIDMESSASDPPPRFMSQTCTVLEAEAKRGWCA